MNLLFLGFGGWGNFGAIWYMHLKICVLLFENMYENAYEWKIVWRYM